MLLTFSFLSECKGDFTTESTETTEKSSVASVNSAVKSSASYGQRLRRGNCRSTVNCGPALEHF